MAVTRGVDFIKTQRFDEKYGWKYREVEYKGHVLDEHISFEPYPTVYPKSGFPRTIFGLSESLSMMRSADTIRHEYIG